MPWPTFHPAGIPLHVVRRGLRRTACFFGEEDRVEFLSALREGAVRFACAVHAYVLMGNHVHLLLTASEGQGTAGLLEAVCARHTRFVRENEDDPGRSLRWEDGFDASSILARRHLLACMRYIELNPVRAGLVSRPEAYRWSSFRSNALGRSDDLIAPHPLYFALGRSADERQAAYRKSFVKRSPGKGSWA